MNGFAFRIFRGLHQPFGERRMRMDHLSDLRNGRAQLDGQRGFMDQIGRVSADDMDAEDSPAFGRGNDFAVA
jgi:hypothetical protein